jgi:putative transcriptional regulator
MPIIKHSRAELDLGKVDWVRVDRTTDEEIDAQIAGDRDTAPEFTGEELARARRVVPNVTPDNVRAIRQRLGLSQRAFAERFGFSVETIRNYEQGHRVPRGPTRVLLAVIAAEPDAVIRSLAADRDARSGGEQNNT